jgi:hypothetical protein
MFVMLPAILALLMFHAVGFVAATISLALFGLGLFGMAYTASEAQSGLGTLLQINTSGDSPPSWTTINEVIDFSMSGKNMFDDTTNMQSTAKEFLATLPDPGKLTCTMNRVSTDAGQKAIFNAFNTRNRMNFQIVLPINYAAGQTTTGDTYSFLAYVETLQPDFKTDKKVVSKMDLQITGGVGFVEGS